MQESDPTYLAHVAFSNANDLCARPSCCNVLGRSLRLAGVSAEDTGVRSESDHCSGLHAADGACAAGDEDDLVLCGRANIGLATRVAFLSLLYTRATH